MSTGNRKRRQELGLLPEPQKCGARNRDGSPCNASPIRGAAVCRMHGGGAPAVIRKAKERLALASEDAVQFLAAVLRDERVPVADRHRAALAILDRAGLPAGLKVDVDQRVSLSFADQVQIIEVLDQFDGDKAKALEVLQDPAALEEFQAQQLEAVKEEDPQLRAVRARLASPEPAPRAELPSVAWRRALERRGQAEESDVVEAELLPDEDYRDPDTTPSGYPPGPPDGPRVRPARIQR